MPTYDYKCLECGKTFELFQSMKDAPIDECRFCKGKVRRLIGTGAGIIFKGSGFYCTDYRSPSYTSAQKKDNSSSSSSSTPSSGGSTSDSGSGSSGSGSGTPSSGSSTPSSGSSSSSSTQS